MPLGAESLKARPGASSATPPPAAAPPSFLSVAEAHHRITNSLQLIASLVRLQASDLTRERRQLSLEDVQLIFEDVAARISSVALLHRLLSSAPQQERIDVATYLREVCIGHAAAFSFAGQVEILSPAEAACITATEQAVPLAIVVGELVTNAIKYAHPSGLPGRIEIACRREDDGSLTVEISDDGVGLPEGFDPMKDGGLGLRVVRTLSRQLEADLAIDSTPLGLTVRLRIPPAQG